VPVIPDLKAGIALSAASELLAQAFRARGIESARLDAHLLAGHALGLDRAGLVAASDRPLAASEVEAIAACAARRLAREPVARIVGCKEFWSLPLRLAPAVLVPRPETETVVEAALEFVIGNAARTRPLRLLDIGTGSGALLLALLSELPNAFGIGTDVSPAALAVARDNAERLGFGARCAFLACDTAAALHGPFDLVVSNPPYISSGEIAALAPEVRDYDPAIALDGGPDGLAAYRAVAADARRLLAPKARLVVELGLGQEAAVATLLALTGLNVCSPARKDLGGIGRALSADAP
jgi:release factor glutamine methyltransferase